MAKFAIGFPYVLCVAIECFLIKNLLVVAYLLQFSSIFMDDRHENNVFLANCFSVISPQYIFPLLTKRSVYLVF